MREIKFRAWDKLDKQMREVSAINFFDEMVTLDEQPNGDYFKRHQALVELMQYTGLKDKNGKEIYEGDIVCWVTDVIVEQIEGHNRYELEGQIGVVKFGNGAFYVDGIDGGAFYSYGEQMFAWSELEIIGNVHENPELLTQNSNRDL